MKSLLDVKWGWFKDPEDKRDFPATKLVYAEMPLPANYIVKPKPQVYNQGSQPACVGYACAGVKSDEEYLQHHGSYLFDGLWLYKECKKIDGIPGTDGTFLRFAMQILQQQGMRQLAPPCKKRSPDNDWQIGEYFRIDNSSTDDFIKQVILQYGSIALGASWYKSWMYVGQVFPKPDVIDGGHAFRIDGWRTDDPAGWVVVNSWGKVLWGKAGEAILPYDMFKVAVLGNGADVWKLVDK